MVPAAAAKLTALVLSVPDTSSLSATSVNAPTLEPVKTPSSVSKLDPAVVTVALPV